jgi:hypothetical protein
MGIMQSTNRVFITRGELERVRALIARDSDAALVAHSAIRRPAEVALQGELIVPEPHGHRYQDGSCPVTGGPVEFRRTHPREHLAPGGLVTGSLAIDRYWCTWMHNNNANDARTCALASVLYGDESYGVHAKRILMTYAQTYGEYQPLGRLIASYGKVQTSALEEAIWGLPLLWATDMLHMTGQLSEDELDVLKIKLFEPLVDLLWGEWYFIHNIRMWINAAIGSVGLFFGDRHAIRHAIFGDKGYRQQLIDGFRADGLHVEGSPGYHAYGSTAMLMLAEAMERCELGPYREDFLKKTAMLPFRIAQPDGTLPGLNDYWARAPLPGRVAATLIARYSDADVKAVAGPAFDQWVQAGAGPDVTLAAHNATPAYWGRSQIDWLLGWENLQGWESMAKPAHEPFIDLRASGVAIVKKAPGHYALVKASKKGSGHDHHDKLSLIYWSRGVCWLSDKGSGSYSAALHEAWFKHTLSHHTVLVDGVKHERLDGHVDACVSDGFAGHVTPYAEQMPDVKMSRKVAMPDDVTLVDVFEVRCEKVRTMDYALHPAGRFEWAGKETPVASLALVEGDVTYANLVDVRELDLATGELNWVQGGQKFVVTLEGLPEGARVFVGTAPADAVFKAVTGTSLVIRVVGVRAVFKVRMRVVG